jgi:hypothetical protein
MPHDARGDFLAGRPRTPVGEAARSYHDCFPLGRVGRRRVWDVVHRQIRKPLICKGAPSRVDQCVGWFTPLHAAGSTYARRAWHRHVRCQRAPALQSEKLWANISWWTPTTDARQSSGCLFTRSTVWATTSTRAHSPKARRMMKTKARASAGAQSAGDCAMGYSPPTGRSTLESIAAGEECAALPAGSATAMAAQRAPALPL